MSPLISRNVSRPSTVVIALAAAAAAVAVLAGPRTARGEDTQLTAADGRLVIPAPGRWRPQKSELPIAASGFLGVKRAELFAVVYDDEKDAASAATRWRTWRTDQGGEPAFADVAGKALHWTAHSSAAGTVDCVRALAGADRTAVVWLRLSGGPGAADDDAWGLLDAATLAERPKAPPEKPGAGAGAEEAPTGEVFKEPSFRFQLRLPQGFALRKDVAPDLRRALSLIGPVGSDKEAFFDLYLLDDFLRATAAASWWQAAERRGWAETLDIQGDPTSFRIEVPGETWTRHVRILDTEGGIVGLKLDVASQVGPEAGTFLDAAVAALEVLKPRQAVPGVPPGFQEQSSDTSVLQVEVGGASTAAKEFLFQADVVEEHVEAMLAIPPVDGRKSVLRVYATDRGLANALRPLGIEDGRAAHWSPEIGAVLTYAGALGTPAGQAALRGELARFSVARRFGFRAPFWLERGIAEIVASAAYNKGRVDAPHPELLRAAQDAAAQTVEFQTVRWWTHEDGGGHTERDAVAWGFAYFFLHGGAASKKWEDSFRGYVKTLRETADPEAAAKSFDLSRQVELAEDWKKFMRKL